MRDGLYFLALGGIGEIGMNTYLYGCGPENDPEWLMVDCGVSFGNGTIPGVDVVLPDISWIENHKHRLSGLVLTHAHEDHLGAIPYLWSRLGCPVYATPFTATVLRAKLSERGLLNQVPIHEISLSSDFSVGSFELRYVTVTHSIPEPNSLVINTPFGRVVHSGDFRFDPDPVVGETSDINTLQALGREGVLSLTIDSTNVFNDGDGDSEASLSVDFEKIIKAAKQRIAVTCFATNIARLQTIINAATSCGRVVCLVGRSLHRITAAAKLNGLLSDTSSFINERDAHLVPDSEILYITTGCQGEPRAALWKIAHGEHRNIQLHRGDTVIFSSRTIPGNELSVERIRNILTRAGVEVVTQREAHVHVSGHPAREELVHMYKLLHPKYVIPMHGETRHLHEQAQLAESCCNAKAIIAENGNMVRIAPHKPAIVNQVPVGRYGIDGGRVIALNGDIISSRLRMMWNGFVVVTVVIDDKGRLLSDPNILAQGLIEKSEHSLLKIASDAASGALREIPRQHLRNDDEVKNAVRIAVRRVFRLEIGKRPITQVHLVRV